MSKAELSAQRLIDTFTKLVQKAVVEGRGDPVALVDDLAVAVHFMFGRKHCATCTCSQSKAALKQRAYRQRKAKG